MEILNKSITLTTRTTTILLLKHYKRKRSWFVRIKTNRSNFTDTVSCFWKDIFLSKYKWDLRRVGLIYGYALNFLSSKCFFLIFLWKNASPKSLKFFFLVKHVALTIPQTLLPHPGGSTHVLDTLVIIPQICFPSSRSTHVMSTRSHITQILLPYPVGSAHVL